MPGQEQCCQVFFCPTGSECEDIVKEKIQEDYQQGRRKPIKAIYIEYVQNYTNVYTLNLIGT